MANATQSNKIYIDTAGQVSDSKVKIAYMVFTPDTANDSVVLRETSSGPDIFFLRAATAKDSMSLWFDKVPLVFNSGLYVQSISSGAKLCLITTTAGGD